MECPNCGRLGSQIAGTMTDRLAASKIASQLRQGNHAAVALSVASTGIKCLASQAYRCNNCGHEWRKWF